MSGGDRPVRRRIECSGAVQGVGFRPTVYRLARSLGLAGWVRNDPAGATIEIEGPPAAVDSFGERLREALPPLARLDGLRIAQLPVEGDPEFTIAPTTLGSRRGALVPPDAALCADCRREMETAGDRRYHYPFTTCTNCGPRFTLARALPYDRDRTSMACFPLCEACGGEYGDPGDRRFHAEPVCCPTCGPRIWAAAPDGAGSSHPGGGGDRRGSEALEQARAALAAGSIVAVKGLGGFQLACRADDRGAVTRLRARKHRPTKPFALMVADLATMRRLVELTPRDEALLVSARGPVLLAPARPGATVVDTIAPGVSDLGIMLPTTPLHVELFREAEFDALVMTSGNVSDEPICRTNRDAADRLKGIADLIVFHDRDIVRRADDSVVRTDRNGAFMVRRARGWVPEPLALPEPAPEPILALGPYLQATACVAVADAAFMSQHIGDLDSESARRFLAEVVDSLETFLDVTPSVIVTDAHPDYPSTWLGEKLARARGVSPWPIHHHLAHACATLAEHDAFPGRDQRAAAIVLDGTGLGPDDTAWGGEVLLVGGDLAWQRAAHLEPLRLIGGERAVREPWRVAVAALTAADSLELLERLPISRLIARERLAAVAAVAHDPDWPFVTGAGRVFEACGALLGLAAVNQWEGEAAARLESLAATHPSPPDDWRELAPERSGGSWVAPTGRLLAAAAHRLAAGQTPAAVAAGFHETFARCLAEAVERAVPAEVTTCALGGGCFVNRILRARLSTALAGQGRKVLLPQRVPPGDGGVAYGQAVAAAVAGARGVEPRYDGGS